MTDMPTPYQTFVALLYQACHSSEATEHYNLGSEASFAHHDTWRWLVNEQHRALLALVWHVQEHAGAILAAIPAPGVEVDPPDCEVLNRFSLTAARFAFLTRYAVAIERGAKPDFETPPNVRWVSHPQPPLTGRNSVMRAHEVINTLFNRTALRSLAKMRTYNDGARALTESIMVPEIAAALRDWSRHQTGGVLVGGIALSSYVKPRMTQDIDVMFLSDSAIPLQVPGFKKTRAHAFQHDATHVGVEIVTPEYAHRPVELFNKVAETATDQEGIKVASPSGLAAMKLYRASLQDQADIVALIHAGQVDITAFPVPGDKRALFQQLVEQAENEKQPPSVP
jgi:hypothetical protein